jgi:hypothetical protein
MGSYPILPPGTLVKPQVRDGRFHWWRVVHDDGPEHLANRVIVLCRTEPERCDQHVLVRRDRVHVDARMSIFDVQPTVSPVAAAPSVAARRERRKSGPRLPTAVPEPEEPGIPDFLRRT